MLDLALLSRVWEKLRRAASDAPSVAAASVGLAVAGCGLALGGEMNGGDPGTVSPPVQMGQDAGTLDASVGKPIGDDLGADAGRSDDGGGVIDEAGPITGNVTSDASEAGDDVHSPLVSDASAPADAAEENEGTSDAADGASQCDFSGTWATKLTIGVNWVPQGITSVILAAGTGTIEQWVKSTRVQTGTTTTDTAFVCGISLPDFSGTNLVGGEKYGVRFPDSLFDNNYIPSFTINGTLSDSTPNATFTTTASATLLGLTLPSPTTTPWPTPVTTEVDSDHDGNPGVTIQTATGTGYSQVPVDLSKTRADELYVVIRQVTMLSGGASDCDHLSGSVSIPRIPATSTGKYAIDSHIIGCALAAGGNCSASQTSFADGTQPVFSPTGTTAFTSVRVATSTTCASVRQALP
jgi:hypothetical protein